MHTLTFINEDSCVYICLDCVTFAPLCTVCYNTCHCGSRYVKWGHVRSKKDVIYNGFRLIAGCVVATSTLFCLATPSVRAKDMDINTTFC